mgnify:CR=1 FL=1
MATVMACYSKFLINNTEGITMLSFIFLSLLTTVVVGLIATAVSALIVDVQSERL